MNRIAYLGIGSNSFFTLNTSAFALRLDGDAWALVDCGVDIPRHIRPISDGFLNVSTLVLTHRHLDHVGGVPYFLFGRNLEATRLLASQEEAASRDLGLDIVCEEEVATAIQAAYRAGHGDDLRYDLRFHFLEGFVGDDYQVNEHTFRFVLVDHTVPCYGFRVWDDEGHSVAYSSDTLPVESFVATAAGADVVIHEAMFPGSAEVVSRRTKHSTAKDAGLALQKIRPKKQALLMHLQPSFFAKKSELEKESSDAAGFEVRYPEEGSTLDL